MTFHRVLPERRIESPGYERPTAQDIDQPIMSEITFPSHRGYRFHQGRVASFIANGIQAVNFLGDRFLRKYHLSAGIAELYQYSMNAAFAGRKPFSLPARRTLPPITRATSPGSIPMCSTPRP